MKNNFCLLISLLICPLLRGSIPSMPYAFWGIEIREMIPFSQEELSVMHNNRINKVKITREERNSEQLFYLNDQGQIEKQEWYITGKKKNRLILTTVYKYNPQGLLILKKSGGLEPSSIDSMIYDKKGRLIYYYSAESHYKTRGKWVSEQSAELKFDCLANEGYVLKGLLFGDSVTCLMNENNESIKFINEENGEIDSVCIEKTEDLVSARRFYFRYLPKGAYNLGKEILYDHGRIKKETVYQRYIVAKYDEHTYHYDELGRLAGIEGMTEFRTKKLFAYNSLGLINEEVEVTPYGEKKDKVRLTTYQYIYN
jgi:hypothetical protein